MGIGMARVFVAQERVTKIALAVITTLAYVPLLVHSDSCGARDILQVNDTSEPEQTIVIDAVSQWLKARFSETDLEAFQPGDLKAEAYYCSCYDLPNKHYPYSLVLLKTPRGDLVARPEGTDGALIFTALAVRYGNRYCQVDSEADCYGAFSHPCEFTDFVYGPSLAQFFPTCKSE